MKTSIIVLAQHASLFKHCLASIRLFTAEPFELIVVNDGGSKDIATILGQTNAPIRTLETPQRVGVAAGYNMGAAAASGERLVFMRDHSIVSEQWLECLSECMDRQPDAAMVGPLSHDVSGWQNAPFPGETMEKFDRSARRLLLAKQGDARQVTRLLSMLLMVNKEAFDKLGGFDERFLLESYEDDDLCYRALQAGYNLYIAQDCFVRYMQPLALFPEDPDWYWKQLSANKQAAFEKWGFDLPKALFNWKRPVSISLCMIVKNEEQTLERCLSSVRDVVDEIVIVDTGSTDKTKEVAAKFADRIADFEWVNDFAKARNFAFRLATKEFILWLDADDVLLPEDAEKLRTLAASLPWDTESVSMHYHLRKDEYGNVASSLRRNRLVRRSRNFRWVGAVHEYLEVYGKILYADIAVTHDRVHTDSSRNLNIYERRLEAGEVFSPRDLYYFANELADHKQWERAHAKYEEFLRLGEGWVEDNISACGRASDCLQQLGRIREAKQMALQAFSYANPRAEGCCRLGFLHMSEQDYAGAVIWYKLATELSKPANTGAILQHACWTWLPHLQLCVCYDRLGERELAKRHNEIAAGFIPNDERVVANRKYFADMSAAAAG